MAGAQKHYSKEDNIFSERTIKAAVFKLLDKNPLLTAKPICKILDLPYRKYRNYVTVLCSRWRTLSEKQRGSKCSVHGWRGWCFLPEEVNGGIRGDAVEVGWIKTRARNRWLLWKDRLGRLQWFETGRVNLFVRKPGSLGKAYQLVCNGFSWTGLVTDIKVLERVLSAVRFKGAHYVFPTKQRLPRLTIDLFSKSNGVVIKVGDRSHPNAVEVVACYPDWAERNERLLKQVNDTLKQLFQPTPNNPRKGEPNYVA